jgi:HAD superfamily hydrolase (TIGR01549 family)
MYDAVLLDLDDTLVDFDRCNQAAVLVGLRAIEQALDLDGARPGIYRAFQPHGRRHWDEGTRTGRPWREIGLRVFESFLAEQGQDAGQAGAAAVAYWEHFGANAFAHDGALAAVEALRGRVRLGLISNGIGQLQRGRLRSLGLDDCFDPLLISEEVGIRKPDRRIFDLAVDRLGLPRERILFVGDSISDDLVGARDAGLRFCHFALAGAASYPPGYVPDHVIASFAALLELLAIEHDPV